MRLDSKDDGQAKPDEGHAKKVSEIHEPAPGEQSPADGKPAAPRRMTLTMEEADKLADLVNQMRERH